VLGNLLDILIRDRTGNEKSLDDVLRLMNTNFAKQGKTYRDSVDVRLTAETIAGGSFEEFFRKYVAGRTLSLSADSGAGRLGSANRGAPETGAWFLIGARAERSLRREHGRFRRACGPCRLASGDVILNWNGDEVPKRVEHWLQEQKAGDLLKLRVRRDDKDISFEFRLGEMKETLYQVIEDSHAGERRATCE